jgi:hypothetical protein
MTFAGAIAALLLLPSVLFLGIPAQAEQVEIELGPSLVCKTEKQVERFIALYDGDVSAAMHAVNAETHDQTACGVANTAYIRGQQLATARNKDRTFSIVQILVVGVADDEGGVESVTPAVLYSLFPVEEIEV